MSTYDYLKNKEKKTKLFSWSHFAKMVAIIFACFIGFFALTILIMYLAGSFEEKVIPPDGIKITLSEQEQQNIEIISGQSVYVPTLTEQQDGSFTFSILVEDALQSVEEGEDVTYKDKANQLDLSVNIADERVLKVYSEECQLGKNLYFEAVKHEDGSLVGGFTDITIHSGDGIYGTTSMRVFIDVPVNEIANNLVSPNTATSIEGELNVNMLSLGDQLKVFKPIYTPARSSNPSVDSLGHAHKEDKIYSYSVEYLTIQAGTLEYNWVDIDGTNTAEDSKIVKWASTANKDTLVAVKTGLFRVKCTTFATYEDQENALDEVQRVESEYTYYRINEVSFESIETQISSYTFEYSMQGIYSIADVKPIRVYLNSKKPQSELERLNAINLGLTIILPEGYSSDREDLLNALANVKISSTNSGVSLWNLAPTINDYYQIKVDEARSNEGWYPIKDATTEFETYKEYYFEVYLTSLYTQGINFTFSLQNTGVQNNIISTNVTFSMKDNQSSISFKNTQSGEDYGEYLSLSVNDTTIDNEITKLMKLRVDTSQEGIDENYVDLNKIIENVPVENGKTPSYWLIKYYVFLADNEMSALDRLSDAKLEIANLGDRVVTVIEGKVYGVEILNGHFKPKAYADYDIYATLIQTNVKGEEIIYNLTGNHTYKSCKLRAEVQVQLNTVEMALFDEDGVEITDYIIKENYTYYLHLMPIINGNIVTDNDILASYINGISIYTSDALGTDKEAPLTIESAKFLDNDLFNGYFAKIIVNSTNSDSVRQLKFVANYYNVDLQIEEQFGVSDVYELVDTAVRSVQFKNITELVLTASWNNALSRVDWKYSEGNLEKTLSNGNEFPLSIAVVGERQEVIVTPSDTAVITVLPTNTGFKLKIGNIIRENRIIVVKAESIENPAIYDEMSIQLNVPSIVFGLVSDTIAGEEVEINTNSNEVKIKGDSKIFNHQVYNGDVVYMLSLIKASINGIDCSSMLQFNFEVNTDYAMFVSDPVYGLGVQFVKNPSSSVVITVLAQGFASTLKYVFKLSNNIVMEYKAIDSMFNEQINTVDNVSIQNQIIMSYFGGYYYPTIVYSTINANLVKLTDILTIKTIPEGSNKPLPELIYTISTGSGYLQVVNTTSVETAQIKVINGRYIVEPIVVGITISEKVETGSSAGASSTFYFLCVPDYYIETGKVPENTKVLCNFGRISVSDNQNAIDISGKTIFYPENYITFRTAGENVELQNNARIYRLQTSANVNYDFLMGANSLFELKDFAGNVLYSNAENFNLFTSNLRTSHRVQSITFNWQTHTATNATSRTGLNINGQQLEITTSAVLTKQIEKVYMFLNYGNNIGIEVVANVIIEPYYELTLNLLNSDIAEASKRAEKEPYISVLNGKDLNGVPTLVLYKAQTILLQNAFVVKNDVSTYVTNFNYSLELNPSNILKIQNATVPTTAKIIAQVFSGAEYAILSVNYNGVKTGFRVVIFIVDNANLELEGSDYGLVSNKVGEIEVGGNNASEASIVQSTTEFNLRDMFKLYTISNSDEEVTLNYKISNQSALNFANIVNGYISFKDCANDTLVEVTITSSLSRIDQDAVVHDLTWVRYFLLKATQFVDITYPYENNIIEFNQLYEDEHFTEGSANKLGMNGYVRVVAGELLNLGYGDNAILKVTHSTTNEDLWSLLQFTVQEYNIATQMWQNSSLYAVSGREFIMPMSISQDYYTRIHVTSIGGVNAYVNVLLSVSENAKPTLTLSYPTETSRVGIADGKQYELRDKNFSQTDIIDLVRYDAGAKATRISVGTTEQTLSRLYLSAVVTNETSVEPIDIGVTVAINQNMQLVITKLNSYIDGTGFAVRVFIRSDYGYYTIDGQKTTYNFYYDNNVSVRPMHPVDQSGVNETITLSSNAQDNILCLNDKFVIVTLDGVAVQLGAENFTLSVSSTYITYIAYMQNGKVYINLSEGEEVLQASGEVLTITLNIVGNDPCEYKIRIIPSVATISNSANEVNSAINPAILACGTQSSLNIPANFINYTNLDDVNLGFEWIGTGLSDFTIVGDYLSGYTIVSNKVVYEPLSYTLYLTITNLDNNIVVRNIPYYITLYPAYKVEVKTSDSVVDSGDGVVFGQVFSGTKYDVSSVSTPIHFGLRYTNDGINYVENTEFSELTLSFALVLDSMATKFKELSFDGIYVKDNISGKIYAEVYGMVVHSRLFAEDFVLRITASTNPQNYQVSEPFSTKSILVKFIANIGAGNIVISDGFNSVNSETNPIVLSASGINLLDYTTITLISSVNLSDVYLTNEILDKKKLFKLLNATYTTFEGENGQENVLHINLVEDDKIGLITKNKNYISPETIVHSITLTLNGVQVKNVYISVPRDFAYTFDSVFTSMYACDEIDLTLLSKTFVGQSGKELVDGNISYKLISSTLGGYVNDNNNEIIADGTNNIIAKIVNNILSIGEDFENYEQEITLLATFTVGEGSGDKVYTAKTSIKVESSYDITVPSELKYISNDDNFDISSLANVITLNQGGQPINVLSELDTNLYSYSIEKRTLAFNSNAVAQQEDIRNAISSIEISVTSSSGALLAQNEMYIIKNSGALAYSAASQQDYLISGTSINLANYVEGTEFYYYDNLNSLKTFAVEGVSSYEVYLLDTQNNVDNIKLCEGKVLETKACASEQVVKLLLVANLSVDGRDVEQFFGIFTLTLFPAMSLNTLYTNNAQEVSIFRALQSYNLMTYIQATSANNANIDVVKRGTTLFNFHIYNASGAKMEIDNQENNEYYTLSRQVVIKDNVYNIVKINNNYYLQVNGENNKLENYAGENILSYENVLYDVQINLNLNLNSVGYTILIECRYENDEIENASVLNTFYFIKVDSMELTLTNNENLVIKSEGQTISYTDFVNENENANSSYDIEFTAIGVYYEVKNGDGHDKTAIIVNTRNLYQVKVSVVIEFIFGSEENPIVYSYASEFLLQSSAKVQNKSDSETKELITENRTTSTSVSNILNDIQYEIGEKQTNRYYNDYSLLSALTISITENSEIRETITYQVSQIERNNAVYFVISSNGGSEYYDITGDSNELSIALQGKEDGNGVDFIQPGFAYEITYTFVSGNQTKNVQFKYAIVQATSELSGPQSIEIQAGETINLRSSDYSYSIKGETISNQSSKLSFVVTDASLLSLSNDNSSLIAKLWYSSNEIAVQSYVFVNYIDNENKVFESYRMPIIVKSKVLPTLSNVNGFPTLSAVAGVKYTYNSGENTLTGYDIYSIDANNEETLLESRVGLDLSSNAGFGEEFKKYFTYNASNKTVGKITNLNQTIQVYLWQEVVIGGDKGSGQKLVLCNRVVSEPTSTKLESSVAYQSDTNLAVVKLTASQSTTFSLVSASDNSSISGVSYSIAYHEKYQNYADVLTFNNNKVSVKSGAANVFIPLVITVVVNEQTTKFLVYIYIAPTSTISNVAIEQIAGSLDAGSKLPSGYTWLAFDGTNVIACGANENVNEAYTYYIALNENSGSYSYKIYSVLNTASILFGSYGDADSFNVAPNKTITGALSLKLNGSVASGATFEVSGNNASISNSVLTISTANLSINNSLNITIYAHYNGATYQKTYYVTVVNPYASFDSIYTHNVNIEYNDGVVYSRINLLELSNFKTIGGYTYSFAISDSYLTNGLNKDGTMLYYNGDLTYSFDISSTEVSISYQEKNFTINNVNIMCEGNVVQTITLKINISRQGASCTGENSYVLNNGNRPYTSISSGDFYTVTSESVLEQEYYLITLKGQSEPCNKVDGIAECTISISSSVEDISLITEEKGGKGYLGSTLTYFNLTGLTFTRDFVGVLTIKISVNVTLKNKDVQDNVYTYYVPYTYNVGASSVFGPLTCSISGTANGAGISSSTNVSSIKTGILYKPSTSTLNDIAFIANIYNVDQYSIAQSGNTYTFASGKNKYEITIARIVCSVNEDNSTTNLGKYQLQYQNIDINATMASINITFINATNTFDVLSYTGGDAGDYPTSVENMASGSGTGVYLTMQNSINVNGGIEYISGFGSTQINEQYVGRGYQTHITHIVMIGGVVSAYSGETKALFYERDGFSVSTLTSTSVLVGIDDAMVVTYNNGSLRLTNAQMQTLYDVYITNASSEFTIQLVLITTTTLEYSHIKPENVIEIISGGEYTVTTSESVLGKILIKNVAENTSTNVNITSIDVVSLNENALTVRNNVLYAKQVLEDTNVTLQVTTYSGATNPPIVIYLDVVILANIYISTKSLVNIEIGKGLDLTTLYSVREGDQNGAEIDFTTLGKIEFHFALGGEIYHYILSQEQKDNAVIEASQAIANAGELITLDIVFTLGDNEANITRAVGISISTEFYDLNIIQDVYTLYAGDSINFDYIHLKVRDNLGNLVLGTSVVDLVPRVDGKNIVNAPTSALPYTINGKVLTAKHLFKDQSASLTVRVTDGQKIYECPIDIYVIGCYTTEQNSIIYQNYSAGLTTTVNDVLSRLTILDRFANEMSSSLFTYSFESQNENIVHSSKTSFRVGYEYYNQHNIEITLKIYNEQYLVNEVPIVIVNVNKDRELQLNLNNDIPITINATSYDITNLFNDGLIKFVKCQWNGENYEVVGEYDISEIGSWWQVSVISGDVSLSGTEIINHQIQNSLITHDLVTLQIQDISTKESVTVKILLQRQAA